MGNEVSAPQHETQADGSVAVAEPAVHQPTSDKPEKHSGEETKPEDGISDLPQASSASFSVASRKEKLQKAKLQKAKLRKPTMNVALLHETLGKSGSGSRQSRKKNKYRFNKDDNSIVATSTDEISQISSRKQPESVSDHEDAKTQDTEETEKTTNKVTDPPPEKESQEEPNNCADLVSVPSEAFQTIVEQSSKEADEQSNNGSRSVGESIACTEDHAKEHAKNNESFATEKGVEIMVNGSMNSSDGVMQSFKIKCASDDTSDVEESSENSRGRNTSSDDEEGSSQDKSTKDTSDTNDARKNDLSTVEPSNSSDENKLYQRRMEEEKAALEQISILRGMIRAQYGISSDQSQLSALHQEYQKREKSNPEGATAEANKGQIDNKDMATSNLDSEWDRDSQFSVSSPKDGRSLSDDSKSLQVETVSSNSSSDGPKSPEGTVISRNDLPPSPNSNRKPIDRQAKALKTIVDESLAEREDACESKTSNKSNHSRASNSSKEYSNHSTGIGKEPIGHAVSVSNSPEAAKKSFGDWIEKKGKLSISEFYDASTIPEKTSSKDSIETDDANVANEDKEDSEIIDIQTEEPLRPETRKENPSIFDQMDDVIPSTEGDEQGIDVMFVEQYEDLFKEFVSIKPKFTDKGSEFMTFLKVMKLQKILEAINDTKESLASKVDSDTNKTEEDDISYASTETKLLEVLQTKAKREVKLKEELKKVQKEKEEMEADLMWKCVVASEKRVKNQKWILEELTQRRSRGEELLSFLPDIAETSLILQCLKKPHVLPDDLLRETVHFQVDNALLHAETVILECHLQSFLENAKTTAWVDTVLMQMTKEQMEALKTAYTANVGITL
jgi:hypothetical protein